MRIQRSFTARPASVGDSARVNTMGSWPSRYNDNCMVLSGIAWRDKEVVDMACTYYGSKSGRCCKHGDSSNVSPAQGDKRSMRQE